ncbi:hypothetical protein GCM10009794_21030 [Rothia terrae]
MKNISSLRVVDKLVSQSREWRCGDTVQIVLSQTQRYYPNYTTLFVCVLDYLKKIKKVQIVLAGVNSYGRRIGINEPFNVNNLQQHMKVTDRVIEFHDQDEAYKITQKYIDVLLESVVCKEGVIDTFEWCIYEILDNVFEHSRAEKGFVMMQLLPQQHRCLIAVADAGRGIHKAMYEGSKESQLDAERIWRADHAIEYSLERGVTSKGKNNQGNGLFGLRSAVEINGGSLLIHSGRGNWSLMNNETRKNYMENRKIINDNAHTTLIDWRLDCRNPVDISQALSSKFSNHNLIEKYEGEEEYIEIVASEIEKASGARQSSAKLRIKIENLINAGAEVIIFNMKGISLVSSSFCDELFGKLYVKLGKNNYKKKIFIHNANPTVGKLINIAIETRIKTGI